MIDTAYIIGQIGKAIYQENGRYFVVRNESPKEPMECRSGDVSLLLDCSSDVVSLSQENLTLSSIKSVLEMETRSHKALVLILGGLDEEMSQRTRSMSVVAVETLLESKSVTSFLRARLLARPLPGKADIHGALDLANAIGAVRVASLYTDVERTQKGSQRLADVWSQICAELSLTNHETAEIERGLIEAGVFADIAITLAAGDQKKFKSTVARSAAKVKSLTHGIQVLNTLQNMLFGVFPDAENCLADDEGETVKDDNERVTAATTSQFKSIAVKRYSKESIKLGDKDLTVETGRVAKQANGSVVIQYGDTMLLVAAVGAQTTRGGIDFFPLTIEYREAHYAAGRIPGNYFRRERRPTEKETLTSLLIDRSCRPLFAEGYRNETQVIASVISADPDNNPDVVALTGASCALYLSDIPFMDPIAAVRIGLIEGRYILNPTYDETRDSRLNLIVAGTEEAIVMVEAGALEVSEEIMVEAIMLAHNEINRLCRWQKELYKALDIQKREVISPEHNEEMVGEIQQRYGDRLRVAMDTTNQEKRDSSAAVDALKKEVVEGYPEDAEEKRLMATNVFDRLQESFFRDDILNSRRRPDGRRFSEIRRISCEIDWLPRAHGSALFTRGETQALVTTTLGTKEDEQFMDDIEKGEIKRRFLLHYNFPHYSVGEVGRFVPSSWREIGHGALARRAIEPVLPNQADFPYTIRIVSDITESNGSSSMASVCGGILSLMDAGVPLKAPVAGLAMGLVMEGNKYAILTDIAGAEDHYGDMDFKVTGTTEGITALQMDIKIGGINSQIMAEALEQARKGRLYILSVMEQAIAEPREDISPYAPRIIQIKINPDKIRDVIGPGGKMIRALVEETGAQINVSDDGVISIATANREAAEAALARIRGITAEAEVGQTYLGTVSRIVDFGAFVEIFSGMDGLLHISEIADHRVSDVRDELREGQQILVKCIGKEGNKINLSRRAVLRDQPRKAEAAGAAGQADD